MNEEIEFTSWKAFGRHVLREQDAFKDEQKEAREKQELNDEKIDERLKEIEKFMAQVKIIGTIALVILGSLEGFVALYLILK